MALPRSSGNGEGRSDVDFFAVMGLTAMATEAEIRKAYRKLSLALHPDKNRHVDADVAAAKFSEMQLAYEVLMDPSARLAAAEKAKSREIHRQRQTAYEGKRKAMAEDLQKREDEDRVKRMREMQSERDRRQLLQRLREEGRRLREEHASKTLKTAQKQFSNGTVHDLRPNRDPERRGLASEPKPTVTSLDLTVQLKFPATSFDMLSQMSRTDASQRSTLEVGLMARFGPVESVAFRKPKAGKTEATAYARFTDIRDAMSAVFIGRKLEAGGPGAAQVLEDIWIDWAYGEPALVAWSRKFAPEWLKGMQIPQSDSDEHRDEIEQPSMPPENIMSMESDILKRMREASRNA